MNDVPISERNGVVWRGCSPLQVSSFPKLLLTGLHQGINVETSLLGVHHVSALSAHIERTHDFYTRVLGLRPIIKTVNQDEPSMYHLFYGDGVGSPGSDMTVFDLPHAARERRGNNSISRTTFRVGGKR